MEYFACVQAIKTYLKSLKIITESNEMAINPRSLAKIYNQVKGTKCYSDILNENGKSPNCCSKWEIKLGEGIDWKACFKKTKKIQEVKLKWFQIRLLHRILATNIVLKEIGIAQDVLCNFCNIERDSIQHCTWNSTKELFCSVQMIILKVTVFLILLLCMQNILSIVADMKKSNLSYVHLERS